VYKHLYAPAGHYTVGSRAAIWGVSIPSAEVVQESLVGEDGDVLVHRRDGSTVSLCDALEKVVEGMWPKIIPVYYSNTMLG
jgi:hypothetical protein